MIVGPIDPTRLSGHHECIPAGRPGGMASVQLGDTSLSARAYLDEQKVMNTCTPFVHIFTTFCKNLEQQLAKFPFRKDLLRVRPRGLTAEA